MAQRVLVPLDGSNKALDALEHALEEHPGAEITVLHALALPELGAAEGTVIIADEQIREAAENAAERILEEADERAASAGYRGELETVVADGKPADVILEHAQDADMVVMGTHGRKGLGQKILGSVAETVVRRSPTTVTVVK